MHSLKSSLLKSFNSKIFKRFVFEKINEVHWMKILKSIWKHLQCTLRIHFAKFFIEHHFWNHIQFIFASFVWFRWRFVLMCNFRFRFRNLFLTFWSYLLFWKMLLQKFAAFFRLLNCRTERNEFDLYVNCQVDRNLYQKRIEKTDLIMIEIFIRNVSNQIVNNWSEFLSLYQKKNFVIVFRKI